MRRRRETNSSFPKSVLCAMTQVRRQIATDCHRLAGRNFIVHIINLGNYALDNYNSVSGVGIWPVLRQQPMLQRSALLSLPQTRGFLSFCRWLLRFPYTETADDAAPLNFTETRCVQIPAYRAEMDRR